MPATQDYARLFQNAPVGIFRSTRQGRITHANPALIQLLGYETEEDVLALDLARDVYADPSDREHLIEAYGPAAYSGAEATWVRADGQRVTVRLSGRPVEGADGKTAAYENFVEDVTKRRNAERALDRVLRSGGAILVRMGVREGRLRPIWVSASVEEVLGVPVDRAVDHDWWLGQVHPDDRPLLQAAQRQVLTDSVATVEYRFEDPSGGHRWFREDLHQSQTDETGGVAEVVGFRIDITELRAREDELRRSERRLRALTAAAPDGIVALDRAGHIAYVNRAARKIFGYDGHELVGERFTVLFPERFRDTNRKVFNEMLRSGDAGSLPPQSLMGLKKDGSEFPGEVAFAVDPDTEGLAVTAIIRDMTWKVELEVERSLLAGDVGTLRDSSGLQRGIIPVCASCKSIRDDEGMWQPMEKYVRDRAPVEFSHGLCDPCVEKLYGSLD